MTCPLIFLKPQLVILRKTDAVEVFDFHSLLRLGGRAPQHNSGISIDGFFIEGRRVMADADFNGAILGYRDAAENLQGHGRGMEAGNALGGHPLPIDVVIHQLWTALLRAVFPLARARLFRMAG